MRVLFLSDPPRGDPVVIDVERKFYVIVYTLDNLYTPPYGTTAMSRDAQ